MTRQEIAALTDAQLEAFIASMGDSKSILMERAQEERNRRFGQFLYGKDNA